MPDDRDRRLAQLAVEGGYLSREEAVQYWQRIQAPGSPRLVQLLVQDGRLSAADLEQLRSRFYAGSGSAPAPPAAPPPAPSAPQPTASGSGVWEDDLRKDALLARVLLGQGSATQDQLRECRQLQLQHKMRLGVVLVRKGYVDRPTVENAIEQVRRQLVGEGMDAVETTRDTGRFGPRAGEHTERMASPAAPGPPANGPPPGPQLADPFASVRGASPFGAPRRGGPPSPMGQVATVLDNSVLPTPERLQPPQGFAPRQDEVPTVLNKPAVRPAAGGGTDRMRPDEPPARPFEVSMEELNPFGGMGPSQPLPSVEELNPFAAGGGGMPPPTPGQPPTQRMPQGIGALQSAGFDDDVPLPSVDELDAFANRPLPPPPSRNRPSGSDPFGPGPNADFKDPDPFASSKKVAGPPDPFGSQGPPSGLTPAGVPVGGVADSDSVKNKAKKVKKKTVTKKSNTSTLLLVLIVASVLLVVLLVVLLNSIL